MNNIIISKFSNYKSKNPSNISLGDWFRDISYKDQIMKIRGLSNKDEIRAIKETLPCITPSGKFSVRNVSGLIEHSGYICIDIDGGDNLHIKNFALLRDELANILNVSYAALSVSGNGVFCLIKITSTDEHKEHFEALKIVFNSLGITVDKACSDVCRLRGISYDENAYFNEDAIPFNQIFEFRKSVESRLTETPFNDSFKRDEDFTKRRVSQIVDSIKSSGIDITEEYIQWFQIGCALANEFGEDGRELFHAVSQNHQKYFHESCNNMFNQCLNNPYKYTIGTFFHWAEEYGLK